MDIKLILQKKTLRNSTLQRSKEKLITMPKTPLAFIQNLFYDIDSKSYARAEKNSKQKQLQAYEKNLEQLKEDLRDALSQMDVFVDKYRNHNPIDYWLNGDSGYQSLKTKLLQIETSIDRQQKIVDTYKDAVETNNWDKWDKLTYSPGD